VSVAYPMLDVNVSYEESVPLDSIWIFAEAKEKET
jgi:hypothetical protein